jgi:hypothetical protein
LSVCRFPVVLVHERVEAQPPILFLCIFSLCQQVQYVRILSIERFLTCQNCLCFFRQIFSFFPTYSSTVTDNSPANREPLKSCSCHYERRWSKVSPEWVNCFQDLVNNLYICLGNLMKYLSLYLVVKFRERFPSEPLKTCSNRLPQRKWVITTFKNPH